MKLSIIVPVYNEEKTLKLLLEKIRQSPLPGIDKEIIIVDDSSEDNSKSLFPDADSADIIKLYHLYNQGKAAAIRTGLKQASGDLILIQDADLEYDPKDYAALLEPVLNDSAEVVFGSRFLGNNWFPLSSWLANKFLVWLTNLLYAADLTDMETCYKLFKKDVLLGLDLQAQGFEFEPEITAKLLLRKIRISEVPISYYPRSKKMGKKIGFFDGVMAVYLLLKYRLSGGKR